MNDAEMLKWGRTEDAQRKADLASVNSQAELERMQLAAETRRLAVGLTASQAAYAVGMAQAEERKAK